MAVWSRTRQSTMWMKLPARAERRRGRAASQMRAAAETRSFIGTRHLVEGAVCHFATKGCIAASAMPSKTAPSKTAPSRS